MSKVESIKGVVKTFWDMAKEDWQLMDRKLIRIAIGALVFILASVFWLYFFRSTTPF